MKKKSNNNARGITLISLVITIIILLILAAISIAMLTGENGVLTQAAIAAEETRAGAVEEQRDLWLIEQNIKIQANDESMIIESVDQIADRLLKEGLLKDEDEVNAIKTNGEVKIASRTIEFYWISAEEELGEVPEIGDYVYYFAPSLSDGDPGWRIFDITDTEITLIPRSAVNSPEINTYGSRLKEELDKNSDYEIEIDTVNLEYMYGDTSINTETKPLDISTLLEKLNIQELKNGESISLNPEDSIYHEILQDYRRDDLLFTEVKTVEISTTSNDDNIDSEGDPNDPYDILVKEIYGYVLSEVDNNLKISSKLLYRGYIYSEGTDNKVDESYVGNVLPLVTFSRDKILDKTEEEEQNIDMGTMGYGWQIQY